MKKREMKPGNMLYPLPAALVSCRGKDGRSNLITLAWVGTVNSDPVMVSVSIRKERFSHDMITETGEFVLNLTNEETIFQTDLCGVKSGRDLDKWEATGLHEAPAHYVKAPLVAECPVNLECKVTQVLELGSHDMYLAEVLAVHADEKYFDQNDKFCMDKCNLVAYVHGEYRKLGDLIGTFGYSVKKNTKKHESSKKTGKTGGPKK